MFAENIKKLRIEYGLSQQKFADLFDVSRNAVTKWECGISAPRLGLATKIAEYFGISVSELYGELQGISQRDKQVLAIYHALNSEQQAAVINMMKAML